jgi:formate dehydrogenase iron-sulfur subunit
MMADKAILYDPSRCTACRGCQVACKQWWGLEGEKTEFWGTYENPKDLSADTWVKIKFTEVTNAKDNLEWVFTRRSCMHCTEASCVKVCPTKALHYHPSGYVAYNKDLCSGCGYCVEFCPFDVPRAKGNDIIGIRKIDKCRFCDDRIANGMEPACVKTCPTDALTFGDRDQLVAAGQKRVQELKATYPDAYLYGEKELGGLHVMYVLLYSPQVHGLPTQPTVPPTAVAWKDILKPVGYAAAALAVVGLGLNYIVARANVNKEAEQKGKK